MSEKGPFDAVIDTLKMIRWSKQEREKRARAAIRILEAAGKVDKGDCLKWLHRAKGWFVKDGPTTMEEIHPQDQICILLETLPGKEK